MIQWWQILLLTLYSAYQICDELTIVSSAGSPVFAGFITGLVMGDLKTGLFIGASLQLTLYRSFSSIDSARCRYFRWSFSY